MRLAYPVALVALLAPAAHADTLTFLFGSGTSAYSGSGMLTTGSLLAPGEYTISSLSGTVSALGAAADSISSLLTAGSFPTPANGGTFPANDNVVFFSNGVGTFSQAGVSFLLASGTQVNLFNGGTGPDVFVLPKGGSGIFETTPITTRAASTVTPEPNPLVLLASGALGLWLLRKASPRLA